MNCCKLLEIAIQDENIVQSGELFYIFGKPIMVNDGDGHLDEMTDELQIEFCPFCGKSLTKSGKYFAEVTEVCHAIYPKKSHFEFEVVRDKMAQLPGTDEFRESQKARDQAEFMNIVLEAARTGNQSKLAEWWRKRFPGWKWWLIGPGSTCVLPDDGRIEA